jgi:hypothetical protein
MLGFLKRKGSKRKLRLFSVACCRRIWHLIDNDTSRAAVLVAERFADGKATAAELEAAHVAAPAVWLQDPLDDARMACFHASTKEVCGTHAAGTSVWAVGFLKLGEARRGGDPVPDGQAFCRPIEAEEQAAQCRFLRDILGNPFQPLPPRKGKRAWEER